MKKQQLTDLNKIEQFNIYECLELYRSLQGQGRALSGSTQYKACMQKLETRIMQLVTV